MFPIESWSSVHFEEWASQSNECCLGVESKVDEVRTGKMPKTRTEKMPKARMRKIITRKILEVIKRKMPKIVTWEKLKIMIWEEVKEDSGVSLISLTNERL